MTSKSYSLSYEEGLRYFQVAQQLFDQNNVEQASLFAKIASEKVPVSPYINLLQTKCAYLLGDFKQALSFINSALDSVNADPELKGENTLFKIKLLEQRSRVYKQLKDLKGYRQDLEDIKAAVQKDLVGLSIPQATLKKIEEATNTEIGSLNDKDTNNTKQEKSVAEREKEAEIVFDLMEISEKKKLLSTENGLVHIISMKWFGQWQRYTNFKKVQARKENKVVQNGEELDNDEDSSRHPGPIDSDDILDLQSNHLLDSETRGSYTNQIIKPGLVEYKDFIIVSHLVWKYLNSIYFGKDITRYVYNKDQSGNITYVEAWLKKVSMKFDFNNNFANQIRVLVCPPISRSQEFSQCKPQVIYTSKKDTVVELIDKIARIYGALYRPDPSIVDLSACQLWKLALDEDVKTLPKRTENSQEPITLKGQILDETTVLDDAEISEADTLVCEFKINGEFKYIGEGHPAGANLNRCRYCNKQPDRLLSCVCKAARYCDDVCQKSDWSAHKEECQKIRHASIKANEVMKEFKISDTKFSPSSRYGLCGLQNLGNTCFMNSALQCLSNISELSYYFLENRFVKDLNKENKLGTGGRCATAYGELLKQLWHGTASSVSPWEVKRMLSVLASQFEGFSQQDSQEFLAYLLDGIHEDLDKVSKKPYIETLEADGRDDEAVAKQSWENHLKRNQSIIVDLMHGQYKSKVVCPDCGRSPITFDPFVNISLPIPSTNTFPLSVFVLFKNSDKLPYKATINVSAAGSTANIQKELTDMFDLPKGTMELYPVKEKCIAEFNTKDWNGKAFKDFEGVLFAYQTYDQELDGPSRDFLEKEKIRMEIQIYHKMGKNEGSELESFARLVNLPAKSSAYDLNVQVFAMMRQYLKSLFLSKPDSPFMIDIDLSKSDLESIKEEYKQFLELGKDPKKGLPYELVIRSRGSKRKQSVPLSREEIPLEEITNGLKQPTIEMLIDSEIPVEHMKLNKCRTYEGTNSTKDLDSYSIYDCFDLFSTPEVLDKDNSWYCNKCKDQKQATKKMDVFKLPKILIIHLKRFKTNKIHSIGKYYFSGGSSKVSTLVNFPIEGLDLRRYAISKSDDPPVYDLIGVVNHYGGLGGGHYTAFAKNPKENEWYEFDDSAVSRQNPAGIVSKAAYILFYKRRENGSSETSS